MSTDYCMIGVDPVLEYSQPRWDPNTGLYWDEKWTGSQHAIEALVSQLNLQQNDTDQTWSTDSNDRPLYHLSISTPDYNDGRSNALNKFELLHNKLEKDICEHPWTLLSLDPARVDYIRGAAKNYTKSTSVTLTSALEAWLFANLTNGVNKYLTDERVLRISLVTSKRFGSYVSELGVFCLWATIDLLKPGVSGIIFPGQMLFNLATVAGVYPYGSSPTISRSGTFGGQSYTEDFIWSWMKQPPDVESLPSGKVRITQEFWLDYWSDTIYPTYGSLIPA